MEKHSFKPFSMILGNIYFQDCLSMLFIVKHKSATDGSILWKACTTLQSSMTKSVDLERFK